MTPTYTPPPVAATRDADLAARLAARLDQQTKPPGSLGRLEALALQIGLIQQTERPALREPQLIVFAADHGLAAHGVSAYPSDVTWQMVENFLAGGAAVSVLAAQHGIALTVVDAGVRHAFAPRERLVVHKIGLGTADALEGPAMTLGDCERALRAGAGVLRELPGNAVLLGEMGIGNTSAASMLMSRLLGIDVEPCIGRGTGLDDRGLANKRRVLRSVLQRHADATTPLAALAAFGGFEIAMLAGAALEAAQQRRLIVVDGFICSAALLAAARLQPRVLDYCVFAHRSADAGHARLLGALGVEPLLDLGLRLGEGSGAALAWPLIASALRLLDGMATFASAGVSNATAG
jgi:nicotinate-nucleotide--dimethylbenzimidazole phosphoribosyltransferase